MHKNNPCIYVIENTINCKKYIGQTTAGFENRIYAHKLALKYKKHKNPHLQSSWEKYGENSFSFYVVEYLGPNASDDFITQREAFWIGFYDALNPACGFNLKEAGSQGKLSDETKKRMSEKRKGFTPSPETIFKAKETCRIKREKRILEKNLSREKARNIKCEMCGKDITKKGRGRQFRCFDCSEIVIKENNHARYIKGKFTVRG